jgi:hypothetical protein
VNAAVIGIGSAEMYLGRLATLLERFEAAENHFEAAQLMHESMDLPLCQAHNLLYWAEMRSRVTPGRTPNGRRSSWMVLAVLLVGSEHTA